MLTDGADEKAILNPASTVECVKIQKPSLEDARSDAERIAGKCGVTIDELTDEQRSYITGWQEGT